MKSTLDIVDILWSRADQSVLKTAISGTICKHRRSPNSTMEDIVINCLPVGNEQLSKTFANVNIHVPDIEITVNGQTDKQPDHVRLQALAALAIPVFNEVWISGMFYGVQQQQLFRDPEAGDHYINIRIAASILNL